MLYRLNRAHVRRLDSSTFTRYVFRSCACMLLLGWATTSVDLGQSAVQAPVLQPQPSHTVLRPEANRLPDANGVMAMREQQTKKRNFDVANAERKRQLNEDSALLLKLARELNVEIEKTSRDTLTVSEIRKIDDIERLAHNVEQKMKLIVGAN